MRFLKLRDFANSFTVPRAMILPQQHVIVFDGICNLCNATVAFVIRHDRSARFHFLSIQSELGREIYTRLGYDPECPGTLLLVTDGVVLDRSNAALGIAQQLGWPWRLLTVGRILPQSWRDFLYDRVARSRYRFFGRRTSCLIPTPALKARFLGDPKVIR